MPTKITNMSQEGELSSVLNKNEIFFQKKLFFTNKYAKTKLLTMSSND